VFKFGQALLLPPFQYCIKPSLSVSQIVSAPTDTPKIVIPLCHSLVDGFLFQRM